MHNIRTAQPISLFRTAKLTQAVMLGLLCAAGPALAQENAASEGPAQAQAQTHAINIPSQRLSTALDSLAAQTGLQFVYPRGIDVLVVERQLHG